MGDDSNGNLTEELHRLVTMTHDKLMLRAIAEAHKSEQPQKCGVVIAKGGMVIAAAYNTQRKSNNASAHAEINAIGKAGRRLGSKNLDECVIYCTCEPCSMCLSAIVFAKIPKLFFGIPLREAFPDNLPLTLTTEELLFHSNHKIELHAGFMKEKCLILLRKN